MRVPHADGPSGDAAPAAEKGPGRLAWVVLATVCLGVFMGALDTSIVNVAYPTLTATFAVPVSMVGWVTVAYMLTRTSLLAIVGRLSDIAGHKRIYVIGFGVFLAGSVLSGMAQRVETLVVFRIVQGVGSAMLVANSVAILAMTFPRNRMGTVLGVLETAVSTGIVVGPVVGGVLIQSFGWRTIFYVNVPIALGAMALAGRVLPPRAGTARRERFDVEGAIAFGCGLASLLLGVSLGSVVGWTGQPIVALLTGGVALLGIFLAIESRVAHPILDLSLFRHRAFAAANLAKLTAYAAAFAVTFMVPFYLQRVIGYPPGVVGAAMIPMPVALAAGSLLGGPLSDRIGAHVIAPIGMGLTVIGSYLFAHLLPAQGYAGLLAAMVVLEFGMGLFIAPNDSVIMNSAPRTQTGIASGVLAMARSVGMITGVVLAGAVFQVRFAAYARVLAHGGPLGPRVSGAAFLSSFHDIYRMTFVMCLLGMALSLLRGHESGADPVARPLRAGGRDPKSL